MTLDPTLRDQLAKTIHDAVCPCPNFPDGHPVSGADYLTAADKAAELLTTQPAPIVLPTVEEFAELIYAGVDTIGTVEAERVAQNLHDLIASRVHWVPVEPGTLIKAGTCYRVEHQWGTMGEYIARQDFRVSATDGRHHIDPATIPAEPTLEERKVAVVLECLDQTDPETHEADARRLLARLDALEADR